MTDSTPATAAPVAMFCDRGEHGKCTREGGAMVYGPGGKVPCGCECHPTTTAAIPSWGYDSARTDGAT